MLIGSNAPTVAPPTQRIRYLDEGDVAILRRSGVTLLDAAGAPADHPILLTGPIETMTGNGSHRHFMQKKIVEQPAVIGATLRSFAEPATHRTMMPDLPFDLSTVTRLATIACGTAAHACLVAIPVRAAGRAPDRLGHRLRVPLPRDTSGGHGGRHLRVTVG
jgi:glucosamine--fructose-6-phosphate aminotransferase (isomerizing)